jgi:hypothetical protein
VVVQLLDDTKTYGSRGLSSMLESCSDNARRRALSSAIEFDTEATHITDLPKVDDRWPQSKS